MLGLQAGLVIMPGPLEGQAKGHWAMWWARFTGFVAFAGRNTAEEFSQATGSSQPEARGRVPLLSLPHAVDLLRRA